MKYLTVILLALLYISCSDEFREEYEEGRSQLVGTWQVTEKRVSVIFGVIFTSSERVEEITLNEDGTGTKTHDEELRYIDWLYQPIPEKISLDMTAGPGSNGVGIVGGNNHFDIVENSSTYQKWNINGDVQAAIDSNVHSQITITDWELVKL